MRSYSSPICSVSCIPLIRDQRSASVQRLVNHWPRIIVMQSRSCIRWHGYRYLSDRLGEWRC